MPSAIPLTIPIIIEEEELFGKIHHSDNNIINTYYALLQIPKQEWVEILQSKEEAFHIKATIWKSEERTRYALLDTHVKIDQGFKLVIINPKIFKRLGLMVKPTNFYANYRLRISVANGDSIELKGWVKFWVEVSRIKREMWAFVMSRKNLNVGLLLGLSWL